MQRARNSRERKQLPRGGNTRSGFRQIFDVEPIAKSWACKSLRAWYLGFGIAPFDARHVKAALLGGVDVCHFQLDRISNCSDGFIVCATA